MRMYVHNTLSVDPGLTRFQMKKYLPSGVLTPNKINVMWGYMRVFFCNQRWTLKSKRRDRFTTTSALQPRSIGLTSKSRGPTVAGMEFEDDDDKDSDVDELIDDDEVSHLKPLS